MIRRLRDYAIHWLDDLDLDGSRPNGSDDMIAATRAPASLSKSAELGLADTV